MASNGTNGAHSTAPAFDTSSTVPLWLGGKEVKLSSTFDVVSPVDHKTLYKCSSASEEDAVKAVAAAAEAFKTWSKTKPNERRDIFLRAAEGFLKRRDELLHYSATETGGKSLWSSMLCSETDYETATESMFAFEHGSAADSCKAIAGLIQVASTSTVPIVAGEGSNAMLVKEPYGVVLGIAPWNAPYALGLRASLQPLAMYVQRPMYLPLLLI